MKWYFEKSYGGKVYCDDGDTIKRVDVEPFLNSTQQLKAEICDCDEGIAWRTEARNNPLSNIVFCAACGRKLSAV
jgi:hypothetical protein